MAQAPLPGGGSAVTQPSDLDCVQTAHVLFEEYGQIWGADDETKDPKVYYKKAIGNGQAALCLSGGGIRSASFALGVIQSLSRAGLLTGFHYLSTVSGGGYIGGWLQRWIHEQGGDAAMVQTRLQAVEEPDEIRRLRENSNFITPRVGLASADTWTAIAISVRNILINWLLFGPLILIIAMLPNLFFQSLMAIRGAVAWDLRILYLLLAGVALLIARATFATVRLLPSYRSEEMAADLKGDRTLAGRIVYPLLAWSVLASLALAVELLQERPTKVFHFTQLYLQNGMDIALFSLGGMVAGLVLGVATLRGDRLKTLFSDWFIWPMSFVITAAWLALGAHIFALYITDASMRAAGVLAVFGPLWILTATLVGAVFFAGFRKSSGPSVRPDEDREWLARLSAVKIRPMLLWAVIATSVLLLAAWLGLFRDDWSLPGLATVGTGVTAVAGGRSARTGNAVRDEVKRGGKALLRQLSFVWLVSIATFAFILLLLALFGHLDAVWVQWLAKRVAWLSRAMGPWSDSVVIAHLLTLIGLGVMVFAFGRLIPVNRFSLNGLYRNRLARAFLGAARPDRKADPFTGFDSADNVRLHLLAPRVGERRILYPVINAALNVTATENLAWQERKAEPFVFTPSWSGSGMLARGTAAPTRRTGAYVPSAIYGGREPDAQMDGASTGVTLATCISISGAAASPNMGYNSSAPTALLMTLFNVRLGAWLPNPALAKELGDGLTRSSPKNSVVALINELTGTTDDRGRNIYLSDGGHFENLALYEMIRRRCRYMVVSDAGADPHCTFGDLGGAVRKVKIDMDVDVDFGAVHIAGRNDPIKDGGLQLAWALGTVTYPDRDDRGERLTGQILYLKPSYFGDDLPVDVISYAKGSEAFPHESTADQFFSESQFESYRRLADYHVTGLLKNLGLARPGTGGVPGLFSALSGWTPPSPPSPPPPSPPPPPGNPGLTGKGKGKRSAGG